MKLKLTFFCLLLIHIQLNAQKNLYKKTLLTLCDALIKTQVSDASLLNYGAFICPSTNPENHPIHSRAAESVYPLAIAYKLTGKSSYRDAAIRAGNWLIKIQTMTGKRAGAWIEDANVPENKGWYGTTTDQLISLAGAYPILKPYLTTSEIEKWNISMIKAADFVASSFPIGNINYTITGAATLVFTYRIVDRPKESWLSKADSLIHIHTLPFINSDKLLTGEGIGVDQGYNMAQSIGYLALYAILKKDARMKKLATDMLKQHELFVYPNGSVDNSWGTRSFKWNYESGTKTAPGVYFSFALLADMDPQFGTTGIRCLTYLNKNLKNGFITYGPHAKNHASSQIPCNYSTFARAQSIALSLEYGPQKIGSKSIPADNKHWTKFFPTVKTAIIRTEKIMATVSAYGEIGRYSRASVCRGGSITNMWFDGFGENGFIQTSSTADYRKYEEVHMPIEQDLLPLTPRIEFSKDSTTFSNIFEANGSINLNQKQAPSVKTMGNLYSSKGEKSSNTFQITHTFFNDYLTKEYTISGPNQVFRIIEPIVKDSGTSFILENDHTVLIKTATNKTWELKIIHNTVPFKITLGTDSKKYWCPFPGIDAYPFIISFSNISEMPQTIKISLKRRT